MRDDYSRSVSMNCSTCGTKDFEYEDENDPIRCIGCGRVYARDELVRENGAVIESEIENVQARILEDIRGDFQKIFKRRR